MKGKNLSIAEKRILAEGMSKDKRRRLRLRDTDLNAKERRQARRRNQMLLDSEE